MTNNNGKIFINPWHSTGFSKTFWDMLKWQFSRNPGPWPESEVTNLNEFQNYNIENQSENLKITFLNHASLLIQVNKKNIIIDPVYSEKIGIKIFGKTIGPSRYKKPGIDFKKLPPIDYVLVTHNHFDHMDIPTLEMFAHNADSHKQNTTTFIIPLKNSKYFEETEIESAEKTKIQELNWWEKIQITNDLSIISVPAQHWSKRSFNDDNQALWSGFIIKYKNKILYIAGDTGLGDHFKLIKEKFPEINIAILPIGSYKPEWFMSFQHLSPKDAISATEILKPQIMIPYHYGSFRLADDGFEEAINEFKILIKDKKIVNERNEITSFEILLEGKGRSF